MRAREWVHACVRVYEAQCSVCYITIDCTVIRALNCWQRAIPCSCATHMHTQGRVYVHGYLDRVSQIGSSCHRMCNSARLPISRPQSLEHCGGSVVIGQTTQPSRMGTDRCICTHWLWLDRLPRSCATSNQMKIPWSNASSYLCQTGSR